MKKRIFLGLCLLMISPVAHAQYWETQKGLDLLDQSPQKAQSYFQKALEYDSNDGRLHYNLANSLSLSKNYQHALISYETALQTLPKKYLNAAHYNLGTTALHHKQLDTAIEHLKTALKNNPNFDAARQNLEVALSQKQAQQSAQDQNNSAPNPDSQSESTHIQTHRNDTLERYIKDQEKQARQNFINRQKEDTRREEKELSW